ncbi:uncharacterized protein [Diabrotica undecimpunctata]|uniref:uncharacterized protein n=1 Tax=Diabrotica undecimpunctata TaxID=50387 RepID=UPI003B6388AF
MTILEWKKKSKEAKENRGKTERNEKSKPFEQERSALKGFIDSIPKMESHYCRSTSTKQYLLPEWQSKTNLYKFYVDDWCKTKSIKPLSITTFNEALDSEKISLFRPKKDQCEKCGAFKVGHISEDEYNLHHIKKNEARQEKDRDKANETLVFTVDLQAVLMAPKSKVSSLYYKTKLCVHNLCFYNLRNKDGFCYIWNETEGNVSAEEFATICSDFITNKILPTLDRTTDYGDTKIILYSDGCNYQNRNVTVSNALLNTAVKENITIEQKYLEVGHTQMEADSMHSTIERCLKNKTINVPADYLGICLSARKIPKKYNVTYLNHTFFKSMKKLEFLKSIRPGKKKGDPKVVDVRALRYNANGQIDYKLRFGDNWKLLPQRLSSGIVPCSLLQLDQLYSERLKISSRKLAMEKEVKYRKYNQQQLQNAVRLVRNEGKTIYKAAKEVEVAWSTLKRANWGGILHCHVI